MRTSDIREIMRVGKTKTVLKFSGTTFSTRSRSVRQSVPLLFESRTFFPHHCGKKWFFFFFLFILRLKRSMS